MSNWEDGLEATVLTCDSNNEAVHFNIFCFVGID